MSMSTSPVNTDDEKTPLLANNDHLHPPQIASIQSSRRNICRPGNEISTTDTSIGPCAKYGNEDDLTNSAIQKSKRAKRKLIIACIICLFFLIGEFVGE